MDLEMPGPSFFRGQALRRALIGGKIDQAHIDVAVRRVSRSLVERSEYKLSHLNDLQVLGLANRAVKSEIPFGQEESLVDTQEVQDFLRVTAQSALVLLKNTNSLLPLKSKAVQRLAVVGPNAKLQVLSGGGSASLRAIRSSSPLEGILLAAEKESVQVEYTPGIFAHRYLPLVNPLVHSARGGQGQLDLEFFETDPTTRGAGVAVIHSLSVDTATNFMCDNLPSHLPAQCYMRVSTTFTPDTSGPWEFGLVVS
jgi:beta-glucosidase